MGLPALTCNRNDRRLLGGRSIKLFFTLNLAWLKRRYAPTVIATALLVVLLIVGAARSLPIGANENLPTAASLADEHAQARAWLSSLNEADLPLRPGHRGEAIRALQAALRYVTGLSLTADGVYGKVTAGAVRRFQHDHGLKVDGVAGPRTVAALTFELAGRAPKQYVVQKGDTLDAIARRHQLAVPILAAVNQVQNVHRLQVGQVLWIPGAVNDLSAPSTATVPVLPAPSEPTPLPSAEVADVTEESADEAGQRDGSKLNVNADTYQAGAQGGTPADPDREANRETKVVALTFNNGPHPDVLPKLLDLLAREKVQATFFFSAGAARRHPDLIEQTLAAGHQIESRGWDEAAVEDMSSRELSKKLVDAQLVLAEMVGRRPQYYRPPGAVTTPPVLAAAANAQLNIVLWTNIGAEDTLVVDANELANRLRPAAYPGAIIMLHADNEIAVEALAQVLPVWREDGAHLLTLAQLLDRGAQWPALNVNN